MPSILVLQPVRPTNPPKLRARADALLARMVAASPALLDVRQWEDAVVVPPMPHPSLYMRHAMVRNAMLDLFLKDEHTHVLWVDSDLIEYPDNLPQLLLEASPNGITAPMVTLDPSPARLQMFSVVERFYDIGGFIENGQRARMEPPWFSQDGAVIELDSVGCCYLAPARLYREGVRYRPAMTDYYVEHWSVMQAAKKRGLRIVALRDVRAVHAWLPDFGMEAN